MVSNIFKASTTISDTKMVVAVVLGKSVGDACASAAAEDIMRIFEAVGDEVEPHEFGREGGVMSKIYRELYRYRNANERIDNESMDLIKTISPKQLWKIWELYTRYTDR